MHREAKLGAIRRLTDHSLLHGSEVLCRMLRYLAEQSIEHPGMPVKEYQIATEVFGRPSDFDPRLDSSVRVQMGRLRAKLAEYYAGEGQNDAVIVEIPKGNYCVHFRGRQQPVVAARPPAVLTKVAPAGVWQWVAGLWPTGALALVIGAVASAVTLETIAASKRATSELAHAPAAVRTFWRPFLTGSEPVLVVFSNAEFIGRPETGMRYFNPATDGAAAIFDHYTGVGEVMAIHELDGLFSMLRHPVRVKRGRLLSWDDAKNADVIFIGSPSENLSLRELPQSMDFVFRNGNAPARPYDLAIVNQKPGPGEQRAYSAPAGLPVTADYAVIALAPGLSPARRILLLAGTTTLGTQAAVEFVCRPSSLADLLQKLRAPEGGPPPSFEGVLHVKISGGVPVESRVVALHRRSG